MQLTHNNQVNKGHSLLRTVCEWLRHSNANRAPQTVPITTGVRCTVNHPAKFVTLSLFVSLVSCNDQGIIPLYSTTEFCSTNASSVNEIHLELEANNISHSYDPIKNCVNSNHDIEAYLPQYEDEPSLAMQPPEGLQPGISTSWGERNNELVAILEANGIEFKVVEYEELEFITWKEEDVEVVENLLELPEWQREMFREMRAESQTSAPNN